MTEPKSSRLEQAIIVLICGVAILTTIVYGGVDSWTLGLISILTSIIALLWISDALITGELKYATSMLQLPVIALFVIGLIQLMPLSGRETPGLLSDVWAATLTMDPYATRFFLVRLAIYLVFFAAGLAYIPTGTRPRRIAATLLVFGTLIAVFGIIQHLAQPEAIYGLRPTPQAKPFGPFVNQHHFAALMEMTSGLALGLLFGAGIGRERKFFVAFAAGIMGMAIVFTGSRGGLISYLAVIAFSGAASVVRGRHVTHRSDHDTRSSMRRNLLVLTAVAGLVILVLGSVLFLGGESSVLRSIGLHDGGGDVTSGRAHFWGIAWQIFLANPIIGAGLDAFGAAFSRYDTWSGVYRVEQAHNDYLQILADAGILGFACVVAFVVMLVKKGISTVTRRNNDVDRAISIGAFAGCFGILIHSFFDFPLRTPANAFFFLLLIVLAVGHTAVHGRRTS